MKKNKKRAPSAKASARPPEARGRSWIWLVAGFVALLAAFVVYQPALGGPFLFDDRYLPFFSPRAPGLPFLRWITGMRPLLMASFWVNYHWSGVDPSSYHLVNLLFHFCTSVLIALAAAKLLEFAGLARRLRAILSVFTGALFLLHPVQTESVAYVASRSENLSVMLFYAAFAVFLYRRSPRISFPRAVAVLALGAAALLTKEHTLVLPALLLLTDYFWNPGFRLEGIRGNWRLYALMAAGGVAGAVRVLQVVLHADTAGFSVKGLTWYQYFFSQCRAIWVYIRLFFLPFGQNADYDFPESNTLLDHGALFGLVALMALVALVALAWIYRKRFPLASYGFFVFLLLLAPTSSFIPIRDLLVERREYLPFLGLELIVLEFLRRWKTSPAALAGTLGAVLAMAGILTYQRNQVWSSTIGFWEDAVAKSPRKARPRFQLAYALYDEQRCAEAVHSYEAAAKLQPLDYELAVDWALALDCAGKPDEALAKLRQAAVFEKSAHVYTQIAKVYAGQRRFDEALAALAEAEKLNPRFDVTYYYRGNIYALQGNVQGAVAEYRRALRINPNNTVVRDALAKLGR